MKIYYVDGNFVPSHQAVIPVDDLAVLRGYGVCDIMRTYSGKPYFIDEHIQRLADSAAKTGIALPWSHDEMKAIALETLEKNPVMEEANIRMVVTAGSSPDYMTPAGAPRLIVMVTPVTQLPQEWYKKGIKVITRVQDRPLAGAKVTAYIPAALALKKAREKDAVEALFVNQHGEVLEGTTSNVFAFFGPMLVTPAAGILKGITRKLILRLADRLFEVKESAITLDRLLKADEIFITGTNKGVVPVVQVDDTVIKAGRPGRRTLELIEALGRHADGFKSDSRPPK